MSNTTPCSETSVAIPTFATVLALATVSVLALPAQAETSPYYFGVAQNLTRASNLTRVPDGLPENGSTISSTSLLAGIDQPFGRQRLRADASIQANRYSNNSVYNNDGYNLSAALDWATADRLSGLLSVAASQTLASFDLQAFNPDTNQFEVVRDRNTERVLDASATARLGVVTAYTLEGRVGHRESEQSAAAYQRRNFDEDSMSLGLKYRPRDALTLGVGARHTRLRFPEYRDIDVDGTLDANRIKRNDIDLTAILVPTGASRLSARLSLTRWTHSQTGLRDYSGVTGALTWGWAPTGKIRVESTLSRESGSESGPVEAGRPLDGSQISNAARVLVTYEATAKINLTATLRYRDRDLSTVDDGVDRSDRTQSVGLGARWTPIRPMLVGCDLGWEQRKASIADQSTWPYSSNTVGCFAQFVIR